MAIPAYYQTLRYGSSGPDVAMVQTWLNGVRDECSWYAALRVDGRCGLTTQNAVRELQLRAGLDCDGKVGRATWDALYNKYAAAHGEAVPYPGLALKSGAAGGTVKLVQQKLAALGYAVGADGKYGAKTAAAVRAWQGKTGLKADGIVGEDTWSKLI